MSLDEIIEAASNSLNIVVVYSTRELLKRTLFQELLSRGLVNIDKSRKECIKLKNGSNIWCLSEEDSRGRKLLSTGPDIFNLKDLE